MKNQKESKEESKRKPNANQDKPKLIIEEKYVLPLPEEDVDQSFMTI